MAVLTSYIWKSVELNDGINYSIPMADTALDDRNSVNATWAYRKDNTPIQTQATIQEGSFVLNINVIWRPGETAAQLEAKYDALKKIFNTMDSQFYQLYRKLPRRIAQQVAADMADRDVAGLVGLGG